MPLARGGQGAPAVVVAPHCEATEGGTGTVGARDLTAAITARTPGNHRVVEDDGGFIDPRLDGKAGETGGRQISGSDLRAAVDGGVMDQCAIAVEENTMRSGAAEGDNLRAEAGIGVRLEHAAGEAVVGDIGKRSGG